MTRQIDEYEIRIKKKVSGDIEAYVDYTASSTTETDLKKISRINLIADSEEVTTLQNIAVLSINAEEGIE